MQLIHILSIISQLSLPILATLFMWQYSIAKGSIASITVTSNDPTNKNNKEVTEKTTIMLRYLLLGTICFIPMVLTSTGLIMFMLIAAYVLWLL